jgi:hypothetical protein
VADIPADVLADIANAEKLAAVSAALIDQPPVGEAMQKSRVAVDTVTATLTARYGAKAEPFISAWRNHFNTIHFQGPSAGSGPAWEAQKMALLTALVS